ncbi:MAG: lipid-binding protein [Bacteroidota bacterium]
MKKYIYILSLFVLTLSSCKKDEVVGGTAVEEMSGDWWVKFERVDDKGVVELPFGNYYPLSTYNTSDNSPSLMWLDDQNAYYGLKAKVNVDYSGKTFVATDAEELYYGVTVTIKNGKVIKNGAVGAVSKAVTDSIAFDAVYSDSPGKTYRYRGYHRTKFSGDDH